VPKFVANIPMLDNTVYPVKTLLARPNSNTKIAKSNKLSGTNGITTVSLSLSPASTSGFNLCASSSAGCRAACLFTSGYAKVHPRTIQPARIAKSRFLRLYPDVFINRLVYELTWARKTANRKGMKLWVRLNTISDVMWEREFPQIFHLFPDVLFYDYTKHFKRMERYIDGELPPNYHLTFSWSGDNLDECVYVLKNRKNVAVPFRIKRTKPLPKKWMGYKVVDGDLTDLRPLDKPGCIIGLREKGDARKDETGFVQIGGLV
jgi:hypothetical protein